METGASLTHGLTKRISKKYYVGKYCIYKSLGKGKFGKVRLATHIPTGEKVAIKKIDKTRLNDGAVERLRREVRIMKRLDHPNVVKLFQGMEGEQHLYLVMEYAEGGDLFRYQNRERLPENEARLKF